MTVHLGDIPTWIAAIGSLVAVGGAIYAGKKAEALLMVEQGRDDESQQREIRNQANQIAGWIYPDAEEVDLLSLAYKISVSSIVSNPSLQPIYNVVILWRIGQRGIKTDRVKIIAPEDSKIWRLPDRFLHHLGPEFSPAWQGIRQEAQKMSEGAADQMGILFSFTDTKGKRWQRNEQGILAEVPMALYDGGTAGVQEDENV